MLIKPSKTHNSASHLKGKEQREIEEGRGMRVKEINAKLKEIDGERNDGIMMKHIHQKDQSRKDTLKKVKID